MFKPAQGFTLVELLVVMTVIATVGVLTLTTNGDFGENQKLKQGGLDIKSLFRLSQTNAFGNIVCGGVNGANWIVKFTSTTNVDLVCLPPGGTETTVKNINLTNQGLSLTTITASGCTAVLPVKVSFSPLTALITFSDNAAEACITSANSLTVNLKNNKTNVTTTVIINKGGTVDVQ